MKSDRSIVLKVKVLEKEKGACNQDSYTAKASTEKEAHDITIYEINRGLGTSK